MSSTKYGLRYQVSAWHQEENVTEHKKSNNTLGSIGMILQQDIIAISSDPSSGHTEALHSVTKTRDS
ncbi:hypothetical protein PsorP6_012642 [Peronosclerospora sorghi]|uniref:Uncharacterized protein n=1 Tax=Peronosclerospora sorghi TaxID=230839 RepID=A0ACC0WFD7_9STRA|nr:hypothetical protein PsorP6_012642 [Peronosclerospora sorghi]